MTSSMRAQWLLGMMVTGLGLIGACDGARQVPRHDGGVPPGGDAGPNHDTGIPIGGHDSGPCNSTDSNNDGIADLLQNVAMSDQDNDTISNMVENLAWLDPWPRGSMTHPPAPQLCAP